MPQRHPHTRHTPGSACNPTPGWSSDAEHDDKFFGINTSGGRTSAAEMDLAQHPTIAELTLIAKASLPRDIRVLWQHTFPTCAVIQVASPTIEKALGGQVGDPTGEVTIEFTSGGAGNGSSTNNSRNITTVIVLGAPASTLADFTGC